MLNQSFVVTSGYIFREVTGSCTVVALDLTGTMQMFGGDTKLSPAAWVVTGVLFVVSSGAFGMPFALKAAASGALGKVGEVVFGWILETSVRPEDLELQRQIALRKQAERERQTEFERRQAELDGAHKRRMQEIDAERKLKDAEDQTKQAEHRRKLEQQAQTVSEESQRQILADRLSNPRTPAPTVVFPPVFVPPGTCVWIAGQYKCNPASDSYDYSVPIDSHPGGYDPKGGDPPNFIPETRP